MSKWLRGSPVPGVKRVIAYASRGLCKSERNYPTHKLEFLALKLAITEKLSDYLTGQTFCVFTDNNPLTYVLTSAFKLIRTTKDTTQSRSW